MRNCTTILALLAAFVLVMFGGVAQAGTIGVSDPLVPSGFDIDDTFHLAFVSTSTRNADMSDPLTDDFGTWDTLVNNDADGSSLSGVGDYTWYAIVSTGNWPGGDSPNPYAVFAKDHAVVSAPVYLLDGSKIADDYADIWDGTIDHAFNVDEDGSTVTGSQGVWTGTKTTGDHHETTRELGGDFPEWGKTDQTGSAWIDKGNSDRGDKANAYRVYALSEELTVISELPTFTSIATGMWDTGTTWDQNPDVPVAANPMIVDGHKVTVRAENPPGTPLTNAGRTLQIKDTAPTGLSEVEIESAATLTISKAVTVTAGTLDIDGTLAAESVDVASGTTLELSGTLTADLLTSAGATTFASGSTATITTLTATGGTTTFESGSLGTVGTINVSGGTVAMSSPTVTQVNVDNAASILNYNSTETTNLDVTDGAVNIGAGAAVTNADFSAGTGTVNATNPLAVGGELKLADGITATYTPGGGATSFSVSGANIVDNTAARTLALSGGTVTVSPGGGAVGGAKFVKVVQNLNDALNLAEVEVFGTGANVAPDGTATQSSTGYGGVASRANDGNTNGLWGGNSVQHTNTGVGQWWQVELASSTDVLSVHVWSRTDCCWARTDDFNLIIEDASHTELYNEQITGVGSDPGRNRLIITGTTPAAINLPNTSFTVTATSTLDVDSTDPATFGNLDVQSGATLTLSGAPEFVFADVVLGSESRIGGGQAVGIGGELEVGDSPGISYIDGDLTMEDSSVYVWELGEAAYDQLVIEEDTSTLATDDGWTLRLVAFDEMANVNSGDSLYIIVFDDATFTGDWHAPTVDTSEVDGNPLWDTGSVVVGQDTGGVYITGLSVVPIPEPNTLALLFSGLLTLLLFARRRRKQ